MKKAVIYARYSCDNQTEQSIEGQLRVCNEYAEKHDIKIIDNYIDRAISGTTDNRPEFKRMLKDSNNKEWDYILVYKFDRFSRNKYESVIHKKSLKDKGISVISAMENIPDTPEGIILESLLEGLNQYYSAELSQKVKRGMRETRLKGNYQGGIRPYGYNNINHKLEINEDEARIVKFIFKEYSLGTIGKDISKKLNKKKVCYKNNQKFNEKHVYHILRQEYYTGMYFCNNEYYCDIYPPIIDKSIYEKVKTILHLNRYGKSVLEPYHYKARIYCKNCGSVYFADSGTSRYGKIHRYYKCSQRRRYHTCKSTAYRKEIIEDYLTSFIKDFISNDDNIENISNVILNKNKQKKNIYLLKSSEDEKRRCEMSLKNLLTAVEDGVYNETTNERIRLLENRISELKAIIYLESNKENTRRTKAYMKKFFQKALTLDGINFVYYLVKKILIDNQSVEIYLECPYNSEYKSFDLIKTLEYTKVYKSKCKTETISREISVFI
ncbi:MAG: recombinase family protein [Christensenellales bacterium]